MSAVRLLIDHGADVNQPDRQGRTPLIAAAWAGKTEYVRLFLAHGANVDAQDSKGRTALDKAERNRHSDIVSMLREIALKRSAK